MFVLVSCAQIHFASELISAMDTKVEPSFGATTCAWLHAASSKPCRYQPIGSSLLHFQLPSVTTPVDVEARIPLVLLMLFTPNNASTHASSRLKPWASLKS